MIVRATAMKNALATGTVCACTGTTDTVGAVVVDFGGRACGIVVYAALQLLSSTAGGIKPYIQTASSSNGGALSPWQDIVAFTSRSCRDSQWQKIAWNCASATSTNRSFYRVAWTQTCNQTNKWLAAMSVEP